VHAIFAGYNFQNGNLVYGPEVTLWSVNATLAGPVELNRLADIRGRLGWAAGDALFYGALGWSWGRYENTSSGFDIDMDGHNIGLGVEYNVTESVFVGVDYTRRSIEGSEAAIDVELDVDTLTLRGGFRF
jgi:opacity protein-like surface antigen